MAAGTARDDGTPWRRSRIPTLRSPTAPCCCAARRPRTRAITAACRDPRSRAGRTCPRTTRSVTRATSSRARGSRRRAARRCRCSPSTPATGSCSAASASRRAGRTAGGGCWVAPEARGRGVASRALALFRDWAPAALGFHRLVLRAHEDNLRSRRVAVATGFTDTRSARNRAPPRPQPRVHPLRLGAQQRVEVERAARDPVPAVGTVRRARPRAPPRAPPARLPERRAARRAPPASASASSGGTSSAAPVPATSGNPPTAGEQQRPPEGERGEQHARLVDLAVREHDEVGAPEQRRQLARRRPAREPAHRGRRARAGAGLTSIRGRPTIHSSAAGGEPRRHASTSTSTPLYAADQAEAQHHGALRGAELRGRPARAVRGRGGRAPRAG